MVNLELSDGLEHIRSEWEILDKLGKGGYGSVFKANKLNGVINGTEVSTCAIKIIEKIEFKEEEVDNLKRVESRYGFLEYYGYGCDDVNYYIYMEYIEGSISIEDRLKSSPKLCTNEIVDAFTYLVETIDCLHRNNIIAHRDIKCGNILLIYDYNKYLVDIKLIDFGFSKALKDPYETFCSGSSGPGTDGYAAPEVKSANGNASLKSDVWSLGCVLLKMLGGDLENTDQQVPIIPSTIHVLFKQILHRCLVVDQNGRFSTRNILELLGYNKKYIFFRFVHDFGDDNLSNNEKILHLEAPGDIPSSVTELHLPTYNCSLAAGVIPDRVTHLYLNEYNKELTVGSIPKNVEYLHLPSYNTPLSLPRVIPDSVTCIYFSKYNHKFIDGVLPNSMKSLNLASYNKELGVGILPDSVSFLYIPSYNHSVLNEGVIPNKVEILNLESYNYELKERVLPDTLKSLSLLEFNHQLTKGAIPKRVEKLSFKKLNQNIEFKAIPKSVTFLDLGDEFDIQMNGDNIPEFSIITLKCSFNFTEPIHRKSLPKSVTDLQLNNYNIELKSNSIPSSVKALTLGSKFEHLETLVHIPSSVVTLKFGDSGFGYENRSSYFTKIKHLIKSSISTLIINEFDVSVDFYENNINEK